MNSLQWITDRAPTAADADKFGRVFVEYKSGRHDVSPWVSVVEGTFDYAGWLPLNNLPPVPKPKTQGELDHDEYIREMLRYNNEINGQTALSWRRAVAYARADLKRQVREIIQASVDKGCTGITSADTAQLRELVKEDAT